MRAANDPAYIEFIAHLRSLRRAKSYSQSQLAERLNKPQSYVSKVETCERRIDAVEAARWCQALGVGLEDALPPNLKPVAAKSKSRRGKR
jgi:transcriptional regulator with XRE-family HTH domain